MPEIIIDGKKYNTEELPKEAIELINSISYTDAEVARLQNLIKVHLAAKAYYMTQLKKLLSKSEENKG